MVRQSVALELGPVAAQPKLSATVRLMAIAVMIAFTKFMLFSAG
jgi:hypothetical protein